MSWKWHVLAVFKLVLLLVCVSVVVTLFWGRSAASAAVVASFASWCWWVYQAQTARRSH